MELQLISVIEQKKDLIIIIYKMTFLHTDMNSDRPSHRHFMFFSHSWKETNTMLAHLTLCTLTGIVHLLHFMLFCTFSQNNTSFRVSIYVIFHFLPHFKITLNVKHLNHLRKIRFNQIFQEDKKLYDVFF